MTDGRYEALFQQSSLAIQIFNASGECIAANEAWEKLWATSREFVIGYNILEDPQAQKKGISDSVRRALKGESIELEPILYDPAEIGKPGRARWVASYVFPIKHAGRVTEVGFFLNDVTAHVQMSEDLRHSRDQLQVIFDAVAEGIMVQDRHGKVIYANDVGARLCGFDSASEMLSTPLQAIIDRFEIFEEGGNILDPNKLPARRIFSGEPNPPALTVLTKQKNNSKVFWSSITARGINGPDGKPALAVSVFRDITSIKEVEQSLSDAADRERSAQEQFRLLAESIPHMVWMADSSKKILYSNKKFQEYLGFNPAEEEIENHEGVVDEAGLRLIGEKWTEAEKFGRPFDIEIQARRASDGVYRWVLARGLPIRSGSLITWFGTWTDIHEQKTSADYARFIAKATSVLFSSLDYKATLAEVAKMAVPEIADWCSFEMPDESGRLRSLGIAHSDPEMIREGYRLLEEFPSPVDAQTGAAHVFRTGKPTVYSNISLQALERGARSHEHFLLMKKLKIHSAILVPVRAHERILGVLNLVSSRPGRFSTENLPLVEELARRAALAIENATLYGRAEEERRKLNSFFVAAPSAIMILKGPDFVIDFLNPQAGKFFPISNYMNRKFLEVIPDPDMNYYTFWRKAYESGQMQKISEYKADLSRRGGKGVLYLDMVAQPLFDNEGKVESLMIYSDDVTAQVESRERIGELARQLQGAVHARDEFLSIASHELKTPLTSLKLQLQISQRNLKQNITEELTKEKLGRMLEVSNQQVNRLTGLVEDLLDVTRIRAGQLSFNFEEADVTGLVRDVAERFGEQSQMINSPIELDLEEGVMAWCDPFRIDQVAVNLVSNALKYGPGKPIRLTLRLHDGKVRFEVRDLGLGIDQAMHERIFERFERAVSPHNISGLGLGLYIVKRIIDNHQGSITVKSRLGEGSTFVVEWPARRPSK